MHPQRELIRLATLKASLRRNIARRRLQCVAVAARATQPLQWLDRLAALSHSLRFTSLAAGPLGDLVMRLVWPRHKVLGAIVRWSPLLYSLIRGQTRAPSRR